MKKLNLLIFSLKQLGRYIIRYINAASSCFYFFTIGIFFEKNRHIISYIVTYIYSFSKIGTYFSPKRIIPQVEISRLIPQNISIEIREPDEIYGNVTLLELVSILKLVRYINPNNVLEIGTFDGRTTLNLACNTSTETKIYSIDIQTYKLRYKNMDYEQKIVQLYGDSTKFDFTLFLNTVDFIFIDANHSYDCVLKDSKIALKLLNKSQGIILWHDYGSFGCPDVTKALNKLYLEKGEFKALSQIKGTTLAYLLVNNDISSKI